jgi:multicomponent K+:H+ antiporter subunit A
VTPLIRVVSLAVLPIALMISFSYLVTAEERPGDGFTAGIITALALALEYLSFGYAQTRRRIRRIRFDYVLFGGLGVALAATVLPLLSGDPLLGMQRLVVAIPVLGELKLSRSMVFDVGIYLVVVGGCMTVIDGLEEAIG